MDLIVGLMISDIILRIVVEASKSVFSRRLDGVARRGPKHGFGHQRNPRTPRDPSALIWVHDIVVSEHLRGRQSGYGIDL